MTKSNNKTIPTKLTISEYLKSLSAEDQKKAKELIKVFRKSTNMKPVIWGNMVGFGSYHYKYDSGREGDMFATGFAMRKSGPTIYIMPGYEDYTKILKKIGPHKLGKSCLYLKNLDDVDYNALEKLIKTGLKDLSKEYPVTKS